MSKENPLTSGDYFQLMLCLNHCIDDMRKMRFVSPSESDRLLKLRNKVEKAYNLAHAKKGK